MHAKHAMSSMATHRTNYRTRIRFKNVLQPPIAHAKPCRVARRYMDCWDFPRFELRHLELLGVCTLPLESSVNAHVGPHETLVPKTAETPDPGIFTNPKI